MGIEISGKIHTIFETQKVSERFTKREFVVEVSDNSKYPQTVLFQLTGDRCSQLDSLSVGAEVRVDFSLRGREWKSPKGETKYFNSLDVWKVEPLRGGVSAGGGRGRGGYDGERGRSASASTDPRDGVEIPRGDDDFRQPAAPDDDIPF